MERAISCGPRPTLYSVYSMPAEQSKRPFNRRITKSVAVKQRLEPREVTPLEVVPHEARVATSDASSDVLTDYESTDDEDTGRAAKRVKIDTGLVSIIN